MDDVLAPRSLTVDLGRNTIEITTGPAGAEVGTDPAEGEVTTEHRPLEMGVRGRLLGIDFDDAYLMVCPAGDDDAGVTRTVTAALTVRRDTARRIQQVSVPRRGAGYEITFPSGNQ